MNSKGVTDAPGAKTLKALVLTTTLPARVGDATPDFVLTLSEELAELGVQVTIVAPRVAESVKTEFVRDVGIRRFRYFPGRWQDLADGAILPNLRQRPSRWLQVIPLLTGLVLAAWREARRADIDVVHAHWIVPGALVARLLNRPYVVTVHGADAYGLQGRVMTHVKRFALRRASAVAPVSDAIAERMSAVWGGGMSIIPMGTDIGDAARRVGARRPVPWRILFIGRLAEKKGVDVLLRALALLPQAELRLVGDGPDRVQLEDLARSLGVSPRVQFLGAQPRQTVFEELARAAVVAIPSKRASDGDEDGVPVVLAEAMAARVPVVVSNAGGLGEHVVDGVSGWLVSSDDPEGLASALGEALTRPDESEKRAIAAYSWASEHLSATVAARQYAGLLQAAARGQAGAS